VTSSSNALRTRAVEACAASGRRGSQNRRHGYIRKMPNRGSASGALKAADSRGPAGYRPDRGCRRPTETRWSRGAFRLSCRESAAGRFVLRAQRPAVAGERSA
jgi:hypothetical protein